MPFENFFLKLGMKKITQGYNSFSSGDTRDILNLGIKFNERKILPLICYEIIYSGKIKRKKSTSRFSN